MKDNISLIAAAAGGFMLSMALTGILHGTPITSLSKHVSGANSSVTVTANRTSKDREAIFANNSL